MKSDIFALHSPSLLGRLRMHPDDEGVWAEFVSRYGGRILEWCGNHQIAPGESKVLTDRFLHLFTVKLRALPQEPRHTLQHYLDLLVHGIWQEMGEVCHPATWAVLDNPTNQTELLQALELELHQELFAEAMLRVARHVESHTWEAFRLTTFERLSGPEAAARLGMKVAGVFVAKNRVQQLLEEEVRNLQQAT